MVEEVLFETEQSRTRGEIADYLRAVAERLDDDGELSLSAGGESVELAVPDRPTFEVKAEREDEDSGTELSVEFELEWDEDRGGDDGSSDELTIE